MNLWFNKWQWGYLGPLLIVEEIVHSELSMLALPVCKRDLFGLFVKDAEAAHDARHRDCVDFIMMSV